MRPGDLQIGDYVIVHDYGRFYEWKHDFVMVVTSVDFSVVGCSGLDDHGVMQHNTYLPSQIEPLPLNIEFLKKNFPEYEEGYEIGWWYEGEWGSYEPRKLSKEKVKEELLLFRRSLIKKSGSECTKLNVISFDYV